MSDAGDDIGRYIGPVARALLGDPNPTFTTAKELRWGNHGSLSVSLEKGTFFDHEAGDGGGVLDLIQKHKGLSNGAAFQWMKAELGIGLGIPQKAMPRIAASYPYTDEHGELLFEVVRFEPKDFRQRRPNGAGGWDWSVKGIRRVPFQLADLFEAIALEKTVYIVEGEKDVLTLNKLGVPATCNPGGANKWPNNFDPYFLGADVVILPDNDDAGRDHAELVRSHLAGKAARVRVIALPGLLDKEDVTDWFDKRGGTLQKLHELVEHAPNGEPPAPSVSPLTATPFRWRDPSQIPVRRWLCGRHMIRGFISVTAAPGGLGKTAQSLADTVSVVTRQDLLRQGISERVPAWYCGLEDPLEEYERRVAALVLHYGLNPLDLEGGLFLDSGRSQDFTIARDGRTGLEIVVPTVDAVIAQVKARGIGLLTVDPFVACHTAPESDNGKVAAVARLWAQIADEAGCAVELIHHVRKGNGTVDLLADDVRGASALVNAARSVRVAMAMSSDEAERAGIKERWKFFRVQNVKANLASPAESAIWRELVGVSLGNGRGGWPDDEVGVVAPWHWPDALQGVTAADLLRVQRAIDGRNLRANVQANDWVGHAIARELTLPTAEKADKARLSSMIKTWLASGALVVTTTTDTKGNARPIIEVGQWAT